MTDADGEHVDEGPLQPELPFLCEPELDFRGSRDEALSRAMAGARRSFSVRIDEVLGATEPDDEVSADGAEGTNEGP